MDPMRSTKSARVIFLLLSTYDQIQTEKLRDIDQKLSETNKLLKDISKIAMESAKLLYQLKIELENERKLKEENKND